MARGALACLGAVALWGAQFPIAKDALATLDAYHLSAIRYAVAALLLAGWMALREGERAFRFHGRFRAVTAVGLIGMTASPLLAYAGLTYTRAEHAAVIFALQPSMTAIADWLLRGRRPANFTLACIALAFAGGLTVVTKGEYRFAIGQRELQGDALVLASSICWVTFTMATESFRGWPAMRFTMLTLIPGAIALVLIAVALAAVGWITAPGLAALASIWGSLAYLSLGGVLAGLILWNWGNQAIGPLNAMLMLNLIPVVTFLFRFAQGQRFSAAEIAGVVVVVGALVANNLYLRAKAR